MQGGGRGQGKGGGKPDDVRNARQHARKVLNDDNFEDALIELDKEGDELKKAKNDPQKWLRDQGIQLPGNPTVEVEEGSFYLKICWKGYFLGIEKQ